MEVMFVRSTNGGLSFSSPIRVNDDPAGNWNWFGTVRVRPNGRVDLGWCGPRHARGGASGWACGLLDTEGDEFKVVGIKYGVKQAADKVTGAGWPALLAERLFLGR